MSGISSGAQMIIVDIEQGSPKWLHWRKEGITASEMPVIMGVSPYQKMEELFLQKIGEAPETESNFAMKRGSDLEPAIRAAAIKATDIEFRPVVICHSDHRWAKASLDGFSIFASENVILECKLNGRLNHEAVAVSETIPEHHMIQIQWQLFCSGATHAVYASSMGSPESDLAIAKIFPNFDLHKILLEKAQWFYNCVLTKTPPSEPISDDLIGLFEKYEQKAMAVKMLEEELEEIKSVIRDLTPANKTFAWKRVSAAWRSRIGSVDYKAISELKGVDLSKYRKPDSKYFEVKVSFK